MKDLLCLVILLIFCIFLIDINQINMLICKVLLHFTTSVLTYKNLKKQYPIIETSKPIYIFYHICPKGDLWKKIVDEQVNDLLKSGLYDKATTIFYGCSCPNCDVILRNAFKNLTKFKELPKAIVPDSDTNENLTINAMIDIAKTVDANFLYIHSKGTTNKSPNAHIWRRFMMYWLVHRNELCLDILKRGFYTIGTIVVASLKHYSGNFFWTTSDFIKKYERIKDTKNRYNAENLILSKKIKNKHIALTTVSMYSGGYRGFIFGFYRNENIKLINNKYCKDDDIEICLFT